MFDFFKIDDERLAKEYGQCKWCGRALLPVSKNEGKCRKHVGIQGRRLYDRFWEDGELKIEDE